MGVGGREGREGNGDGSVHVYCKLLCNRYCMVRSVLLNIKYPTQIYILHVIGSLPYVATPPRNNSVVAIEKRYC